MRYSKVQILTNSLIIILLWYISGSLFYYLWHYVETKCKLIFNFDAMFGISLTLGLLNGITSAGIFEIFSNINKKTIKILFLLFSITYVISMIIFIAYSFSYLYYLYSFCSIIGFIVMYIEFNHPRKN